MFRENVDVNYPVTPVIHLKFKIDAKVQLPIGFSSWSALFLLVFKLPTTADFLLKIDLLCNTMNKVNLALIFCLFGFSDSCFNRYNRALDRLNCPKEYNVWLSGKVWKMTQIHFQYIFTMKTVSQSMNKMTSIHHHVTPNWTKTFMGRLSLLFVQKKEVGRR